MNEHFNAIIRSIAKGDTSVVENFFSKPGGRKYLENLTLILIHALPHHFGEKEELYAGFVEVLDCMEEKIHHRKEGQQILDAVFK